MIQHTTLLSFPPGCRAGFLVRRSKRFFVECITEAGPLWAHTNNSGAMTGLLAPGAPVWLSPALKEGRKLPWTLELLGHRAALPPFTGGARLCDPAPMWVGVNTATPNRLLQAAFNAGLLPWTRGYTEFRPEAKRGESRLDALLTGTGLPPLWVECKNVTLVEDGVATFPDAVSVRAHKHLREMASITAGGERAAFFYCIQRPDARCFGPADYVDAVYAELYHETRALGVESYPYVVEASPHGIKLGNLLPLQAH